MADDVLEILDGDRAGDLLPIAGRTLRIGRKPGNDLVLADEKTSGVHCEIVPEGDRFVLRDLGSTNGTFLDGKRITEMVLTSGDVVTVGRIRVRFRSAADSAAVDAGELTVRRLDAGRLGARGGSLAWLLVVVLALGGGAGAWWWLSRSDGESGGERPQRQRELLVVAGNRLAAAIAGCEQEEGWELRAAGAGFQLAGVAHTGTSAFAAARGDAPAREAPDFAVMRLAEPIPVFAGRTMTIAAYGRTAGSAELAVRGVAFAGSEQLPFRFRTGTRFTSSPGWHRHAVVFPVPVGCDRLLVEIVAVLPAAGDEAWVDDIAITESGEGAAIEARLADSGQAVIGTGAALAVRSTDTDNPAILLGVAPGAVPAALAELHRADSCVLSDLGMQLRIEPGGSSVGLSLVGAQPGAAALQLAVPAESAGVLLAAGAEGRFAAVAAASEFEAAAVLLGSRATRMLVRADRPVACSGRLSGGVYRLTIGAGQVELVLGFRPERQAAAEHLRQARQAVAEGRPGAALARLRELAQTVPMDTELLTEAMQLRGELLAAQSTELARLQRELEEAMFFTTRGGFERVVEGVELLLQRYGEQNLEDPQAVAALSTAAREQLERIDQQRRAVQRQRLQALAEAFQGAQQNELARLVQDYVARQLN